MTEQDTVDSFRAGVNMEQEQYYPGQWQSEMIRRVQALGYNGFRFGPGVRWWPVDAAGNDVAGPFTSTQEFDAWLTEQEKQKSTDANAS